MMQISTKSATKVAKEIFDKIMEHQYGSIIRVFQLEMIRANDLQIETIKAELDMFFHSEASKYLMYSVARKLLPKILQFPTVLKYLAEQLLN